MQTTKSTKPHRPHGGGTLYRNGHKWMMRVVLGGKIHMRTAGTNNRREAEARLAEFAAEIRARSFATQTAAIPVVATVAPCPAPPTLPLDEIGRAFARSTRRGDCAPDTLNRYLAQIKELTDFLRRAAPDARGMRDVTEAHAEAYLNTMRGRAADTYNKRVTLFRAVWNALGESAGCAANPWARVVKRKKDTQRRRALTREEIDALLAVTHGETRTLFRLGLYTGLRLGDCVRIRWNDCDFDAGILSVTPRKTARSSGVRVEIPMFAELRETLIAARGTATECAGRILPRLCARYERDPAKTHARVISRAFERAGIATHDPSNPRRPLVGFHSLRHTFVTICALRGVPMSIVQSIVGHSSVKMTEYYAHTNREAAREALERAFSGAPGG